MDRSRDTLHPLKITFVTARKLTGGFVCVLSEIQCYLLIYSFWFDTAASYRHIPVLYGIVDPKKYQVYILFTKLAPISLSELRFNSKATFSFECYFREYDVRVMMLFREFCIVSTSVDNSLIDISRYSKNSSLLDVALMLLEEILPWSDLKVAATRLRNGLEIQRLHSGRKSTRKGDPTERLNDMTIKIYRRLFNCFNFSQHERR